MGSDREGPGVWGRVRARPWSWGVAAALAVAAVVVLVWFQPQTLLYDTTVDDDLPDAAADEAGDRVARGEQPDPDEPAGGEQPDPDEPAEPEGPEAQLAGAFESRNRYTVEGTATVYELGDGSRVLRLEDFSSTNGPDLYVYLVAGDASEDDADLAADSVDLGDLKGNVGNQNYDIPDETDLSRYDTVLIWCERFTVGFGAADLGPADD